MNTNEVKEVMRRAETVTWEKSVKFIIVLFVALSPTHTHTSEPLASERLLALRLPEETWTNTPL